VTKNILCSSVNAKYPNFPEDLVSKTRNINRKIFKTKFEGCRSCYFSGGHSPSSQTQIHGFVPRPIFMESVVKSYSPNASVCTCQQLFCDVSHSYLICLPQILRNLGSRQRRQIKQWPQTNRLFTDWDNSNSDLRASILGIRFQIWNPKLQVFVTLLPFFRRDVDNSSLRRKFTRLLLTGRVTMALL